MNSSKVIELKVNHDLLDPNFDCYRVSIAPIVTYSQPIDNSVNEIQLRDNEFSYLHVSMASQLNHLYLDPFCCQSVYFVSKLGHIYGTTIQLINGNLTKPKTVYSIPEYSSGLTTLSFADNELAIISESFGV